MNTPNQIDISIIIPIYNVEKYLTVCIDSLMNQGDLRMEIILVNDGSTDLSGEIADEYAKKEERIKVIHQENGGHPQLATLVWILLRESTSLFWIVMTGLKMNHYLFYMMRR